MADGKGVSANQRRRLDALKIALQKHIACGDDTRYSSRDPIRAWVSYVKNSKDALILKRKFEDELETMGPKPYFVFKLLIVMAWSSFSKLVTTHNQHFGYQIVSL